MIAYDPRIIVLLCHAWRNSEVDANVKRTLREDLFFSLSLSLSLSIEFSAGLRSVRAEHVLYTRIQYVEYYIILICGRKVVVRRVQATTVFLLYTRNNNTNTH